MTVQRYADCARRFAIAAASWTAIPAQAHMVPTTYVVDLENHKNLTDLPAPLATIALLGQRVTNQGWLTQEAISFPSFVLEADCNAVVLVEAASGLLDFYIDFPTLLADNVPRPFALLFSAMSPGMCRL